AAHATPAFPVVHPLAPRHARQEHEPSTAGKGATAAATHNPLASPPANRSRDCGTIYIPASQLPPAAKTPQIQTPGTAGPPNTLPPARSNSSPDSAPPPPRSH